MKPYARGLIKYLFLFLVGGFSYFYLEIFYRGYSHFSMIICAGLAFILCGKLNRRFGKHLSFVTKMVMNCLIITAMEFVTGCLVNLTLNLHVWDYSRLPYNFMGQICLFYSMIWLALSIICILAYDGICWLIFDEEKPQYKII